MDVYVECCTVKAKEKARTVKTKTQVRKTYKERTRKGIQKKKFASRAKIFCSQKQSYVVPRKSMNGVTILIILYARMAWTKTILYFYFFYH
jgi:hypothetical protein